MDWVERAREIIRRIPQTAWVLGAVGLSFIIIGIVTHFTAGNDTGGSTTLPSVAPLSSISAP